MYKEQCAHGRHTEGQRHLVTAMLLGASGVFMGIASTNGFTIEMLPLAVTVSIMGILGIFFARAYEAKWDEITVKRRYYREKLEDIVDISPIPKDYIPRNMPADMEIKRRRFTRLRVFWNLTFVLVIIVGGVASALCVIKYDPMNNRHHLSANLQCDELFGK